MREAIIDRIEEQRHKMGSRYFCGISIAGLLLSIIALAISPDFLGDVTSIILVVLATVLILVIIAYTYRVQKYGGQYIEWKEDRIVFKTRKHRTSTIPIDQIEGINIQFDQVEFLMKDGSKAKLNFIDFHDVEDRRRIKSNFEIMKTVLKAG